MHDRGGTWVAFGLNGTDTVSGPGARDAMWLGVLARTGRRGTRVCRPRIHRRGWEFQYPLSIPDYAARLEARRGGRRVAFAHDDRLLRELGFLHSWEGDGPARVGGRGDGWVIHRSP